MALVCANALGSRPGFYEGEVLFLLSDPWVRRCRTHFNCTNRPGLCIRLRLSEKKWEARFRHYCTLKCDGPCGHIFLLTGNCHAMYRYVSCRYRHSSVYLTEQTKRRMGACMCVSALCVCVLIPGCESGHIYNATQYATKMEKKSCLASAARPRIIIIISHQQNAESLQLKKAHSCTYPKSALV